MLGSGGQAQAPTETLLTHDKAYNPIPSPDGKYIAYVRTGWGRPGGSGGFGRSNLISDVQVMDLSGNLTTPAPLCHEFLAGWTADSKHVICFRDGRYMVADIDAPMPPEQHLPTYGIPTGTERVAYDNGTNKVIWIRRLDDEEPESPAILESSDGVIARHKWIGDLVAASSDGRYVAVTGCWSGARLWVFDTQLKKWSDLGEITIHPDANWDYIKPSWNPWFGDGSRLAFFTKKTRVLSIVSPDGTQRVNISVSQTAGLAAPSPDGQSVAYVTFEPRAMKLRPELNFWGGTQVWVTPVAEGAHPTPVTKPSPDQTYTLRWLDDHTLVFDRIAESELYKQAHIWKAQVPR